MIIYSFVVVAAFGCLFELMIIGLHMSEQLTKEEIDAYVAEYTLLADKSKNVRDFLDKKGLTNKDTSYLSYPNLPKKAQQLFHILYDIKHKIK